MESSISDSKAGELSCISISVSATLDCCGNQTKLKKFLIEEASMSAQVSYQVANLGSNGSILMNNQILELVVNVRIVDILIEVFRNTCQLRNQAQSIDDEDRAVVVIQESILVDDSQSVALNELLGELL